MKKNKKTDPQRCGLKMINLTPNPTATQVKLTKPAKPTNQPEEPAPLVLNTSNALMMMMTNNFKQKHAAIFAKNSTWHRFEISSCNLPDTELVLQRVQQAVLPFELSPVKINRTEDTISFLASRCGPAIESLCRKGMVIRSTESHGFDLYVQVTVGFCVDGNLNPQKYYKKLLHERFNSSTKSLDLSNFHKNQDDNNKCRYQLSSNAIQRQVFLCLRTNVQNVVSISVANNQISSLKGFALLCHLKSLYKLDLSQNLIINVNELSHLQTLQIKELLLNENPLCEKYVHEEAYIKDVQSIIPLLQKLDGAMISCVGLPRTKKNFILLPDNLSLADQFVEYYFTLFDSANRKNMDGLYHENALFSLSATCIPGQMSTSTARLTQYMVQSRNLVLLSDYSKSVTKLRQGSQQVLEAVCQLPRTEHDPYSFKVDLIQCNPVVISVSGVFKEVAKTKVSLIRSFYRVFVLVKTGPKSYQIANETLHITNATTEQAEEAFRYPKPPPRISVDLNENDFKKEQMVQFMSELTMMNKKWSRKCLEETNWNIKEALTIFTELYKIDKIPEEAFTKDCTA